MVDTGAGISIVDLDLAPGLGLQQNGEHEISGTPTTGAYPALRTDLRVPLAAHGGACTNVPRPLVAVRGACGPGFRGRRPNGHQGAAIWRPRYTSTRAAPVTATPAGGLRRHHRFGRFSDHHQRERTPDHLRPDGPDGCPERPGGCGVADRDR